MAVNNCKILTCELVYHLRVDCDNFKMYMLNSKAATKITKPLVIANKPIKEWKDSLKICNNPKECRKK